MGCKHTGSHQLGVNSSHWEGTWGAEANYHIAVRKACTSWDARSHSSCGLSHCCATVRCAEGSVGGSGGGITPSHPAEQAPQIFDHVNTMRDTMSADSTVGQSNVLATVVLLKTPLFAGV